MAFRGKRIKPLVKFASRSSRAFISSSRVRKKKSASGGLIRTVVYNAGNMGTEFTV